MKLVSAKAPIVRDRLYWCSFCPTRMQGHLLAAHLEKKHADIVAHAPGGQLEFVEAHVVRKAKKSKKDLPGQTLFGFAEGERRG